jgi:hypothetical protein
VAGGYKSPNNVFPTLSLGKNDIYGKPIWLTNNFTKLANLVNTDPTNYGLGIMRSMHHGNGVHEIGQSYMNCFWQSPVATIYPSTAAVMAKLLEGQSGLGIPAVVVLGNNGDEFNDAKGTPTPTALEVSGQNSATVQMLKMPANVDAARYARRKAIADAIEKSSNHPDNSVDAWKKVSKDSYDITTKGAAAKAFDLTGVPLLPGGPTGRAASLYSLTLAQQLVLNGIPYVAMGIGGNDTHTNNRAGVTTNWGDTVDPAVAQMAQNFKAAGKKVLIVMGGDFGRTPASVASGRDGRDHHPSGFSWALFSVGQSKFKTNAVGDTGPDGVWTLSSATKLVDPIYPGVLGGLIYRSMGYAVGTDPRTDVQTATGHNSPPVDKTMATSAARGNSTWLMQQFGLA